MIEITLFKCRRIQWARHRETERDDCTKGSYRGHPRRHRPQARIKAGLVFTADSRVSFEPNLARANSLGLRRAPIRVSYVQSWSVIKNLAGMMIEPLLFAIQFYLAGARLDETSALRTLRTSFAGSLRSGGKVFQSSSKIIFLISAALSSVGGCEAK